MEENKRPITEKLSGLSYKPLYYEPKRVKV